MQLYKTFYLFLILLFCRFVSYIYQYINPLLKCRSSFRPGSVIVKFVLIFKQSVSNDHATSILKAAVDNGKFGPFTVNTKSIMASEKDEFQIIYITSIPSSGNRLVARSFFYLIQLVALIFMLCFKLNQGVKLMTPVLCLETI